MQPDKISIKPLIISEHASEKFGGEAVLPLHYFRQLRKRGIDAHLIVHERTRPDLVKIDDSACIHYVEESRAVLLLHKVAQLLPTRLCAVTLAVLMKFLTQRKAKRLAKQLIKEQGFNIVHQPIPVSPKEPSVLYGMDCPVVIGPMNGGMNYPVGFVQHQQLGLIAFELLRSLSPLAHRAIPGKLKAQALLVANSRSAQSLPSGIQGKVIHLPENGVILDRWAASQHSECISTDATRFLFIGRLVDWKGVDYLLKALANTIKSCNVTLEIIGDGDERDRLQHLSIQLGLGDCVTFSGWLSQSECAERLACSDALVLPSILECGGAVVLEAMASGKAVIATRWGGPCDYLDESCGILVDPTTPDLFVNGLAEAMITLATNPKLCQQMGASGYSKVKSDFDWERKINRILNIYTEVIESYDAASKVEQVAENIVENATVLPLNQ